MHYNKKTEMSDIMLENIRKKTIYNLYKTKQRLIIKEKGTIEQINDILLNNLEEYKEQITYETLRKIEVLQKKEFDVDQLHLKQNLNVIQEKLIILYRIFIFMLGLIDARLEKENKYPEDLLEYRKRIIQDFNYFKDVNNESVEEAMQCIPMYQHFKSMLESIPNNQFKYNLQGEAIQAYFKGYNIIPSYSIKKTMNFYDLVIHEMVKTSRKAYQDIEKVEELESKQKEKMQRKSY